MKDNFGWHGEPWFSWTNFWVIGGQTFFALAIIKLIILCLDLIF